MHMLSSLVDDASKTERLERFWEEHRSDSNDSRPSPSVVRSHNRARALSSLTAVLPSEQSLPPSHPALSILNYIDTFGPLVFPLQRAALLRKRILFIAPPPVRLMCEYGMVPILPAYSKRAV